MVANFRAVGVDERYDPAAAAFKPDAQMPESEPCRYPFPAVYCIGRDKLPARGTACMERENFPAAERISYDALFTVVASVKIFDFFEYHTNTIFACYL